MLGLSLKTLEWSIIALVLTLIGTKSFEKMYYETTEQLTEQQARRDYDKAMDLLDKIDLDRSLDISEEIYRIVAIDVEKNRLYRDLNQQLLEVESTDALEQLTMEYLKSYIVKYTQALRKEDISFVEGEILYKSEVLDLDVDAVYVLGSLLESFENIPQTEEEKKEWMDFVIKQILATELYEPVGTTKKLALSPKKSERENL